MGSRITTASLVDMFTEQCPLYMAMGMSYDEFWHSTADELKATRKAYEYKKKIEDEKEWRLGIYVNNAIGSVIDKHFKYPTQPFSWEQEEKKSMPPETAAQTDALRFAQFAEAFNGR